MVLITEFWGCEYLQSVVFYGPFKVGVGTLASA